MFLYRHPKALTGAVHVLEDLYLSGNSDVLDVLLGQLDPHVQRYFIGYSGWAAAQLDMEIAEGAWYVLPAELESILGMNPKQMWRELLLRATAVKT
jgi:putative transcriptional regulator